MAMTAHYHNQLTFGIQRPTICGIVSSATREPASKRVFAFLEVPMQIGLILRVVAVVCFVLACVGVWAPLVPAGLACWCMSTLLKA